jgi:hypothetical protein
VGVVAVVVGLLSVAAQFSVRPALVVDGLAGLAAGGWCSLNFWRCRHAHCLITGPGWLAFGVFALAKAIVGHSLSWYHDHRTNAIASHPSRLSRARFQKTDLLTGQVSGPLAGSAASEHPMLG